MPCHPMRLCLSHDLLRDEVVECSVHAVVLVSKNQCESMLTTIHWNRGALYWDCLHFYGKQEAVF